METTAKHFLDTKLLTAFFCCLCFGPHVADFLKCGNKFVLQDFMGSKSAVSSIGNCLSSTTHIGTKKLLSFLSATDKGQFAVDLPVVCSL